MQKNSRLKNECNPTASLEKMPKPMQQVNSDGVIIPQLSLSKFATIANSNRVNSENFQDTTGQFNMASGSLAFA